jgi:hypothetical protein
MKTEQSREAWNKAATLLADAASAIWEHRSDLAWVRRRARMEPADHRDPDQVCRLKDDTDLWPDRARPERYGTRPACVAEDAYPRPGLSRELPPGLSFMSGLNAIAHPAEGLYAHDGNPVMPLMAEDEIRASAARLRGIENEFEACLATSDCFWGARLCGCVLGHVGMALHRKLCHASGEKLQPAAR